MCELPLFLLFVVDTVPVCTPCGANTFWCITDTRSIINSGEISGEWGCVNFIREPGRFGGVFYFYRIPRYTVRDISLSDFGSSILHGDFYDTYVYMSCMSLPMSLVYVLYMSCRVSGLLISTGISVVDMFT